MTSKTVCGFESDIRHTTFDMEGEKKQAARETVAGHHCQDILSAAITGQRGILPPHV